MVGAYLIGSKGTARHAAFLGLTVTITHTAGVFALGMITLFASQYIVPERIFPMLSFVSGAIVLVLGLTLFVRRLRIARRAARTLMRKVPTRTMFPSRILTIMPATHPLLIRMAGWSIRICPREQTAALLPGAAFLHLVFPVDSCLVRQRWWSCFRPSRFIESATGSCWWSRSAPDWPLP